MSARRRLLRLFVAALVAVASVGSGETTRGVPQRAEFSEQVKRGEATYLDECARCHSETLGGTEFGPALVGHEFVRSWTGKNVGDMFVRVRDTMPIDGAGRLAAQQAVDVVAFILQENEVDVAGQPLAAEAAALNRIVIKAP